MSQFEGNNDLLKASFDFYRVSSGFGPVHAAFNKYGLSIHDRLTQAEIHPDVSYGISLDGYLPLKKKSLSLLTDALKEQILTEVPKDTLENDPVLLLPKSLIPKRSNYELYFAILAPIAYALPLASSKVEKNRDA
ncbi:MAG: hypothetical protein HGA85_02320 [Nanoarchaeota archaeon]|nr:hypothetical protein [Nanoarchaeota archaeon]